MDIRNIVPRSAKRRRINSSSATQNQSLSRKMVKILDDTWLEALKHLTCPKWSKMSLVCRRVKGIVQRNVSRLPRQVIERITLNSVYLINEPSMKHSLRVLLHPASYVKVVEMPTVNQNLINGICNGEKRYIRCNSLKLKPYWEISLMFISLIFYCTVANILYYSVIIALQKYFPLDMKGKAILITCCDRGFGCELALKCSKNGMTVFAECLSHEPFSALREKRATANVRFVENQHRLLPLKSMPLCCRRIYRQLHIGRPALYGNTSSLFRLHKQTSLNKDRVLWMARLRLSPPQSLHKGIEEKSAEDQSPVNAMFA